MQTSYKITDKLYLVHQTREQAVVAKPVPVPTNHILVIDCSGSMYSDLPQIREQLKKKLPKLLQENDTVSIIWFSGRGEFGALLEAEPVSTLKDLQTVNASIDRWLKTVGLTGFKDPLEEVSRLVERVRVKNPKSQFSMMFLSDGGNNDGSREGVLKALEPLTSKLSASTFVEYGYYADRNLLTQMAEKCGGQLVFSKTFDSYDPIFESVVQKRVIGAPRVKVDFTKPEYDFAFSVDDDEVVSYTYEDGGVLVPENVQNVFYLSSKSIGTKADLSDYFEKRITASNTGDRVETASYVLLSLLANRVKPDAIYPLLRSIGDVRLIEAYSGCFGKQKYSEFMEMAKLAAFDPQLKMVEGRDPTRVPREDAFTLLELLQLVSEDSGACNVLLDSPDFKYSRIGRGRQDVSEVMTTEEIQELQSLTLRISSEKNVKRLKEMQEEMQALLDKKGTPLKFVADPLPNGAPISSLTFNETTPNVSILVRRTGTVDLSGVIPESFKGKIPEQFPTFIYRNYAVIKDGLVNVSRLPVSMSENLYQDLCSIESTDRSRKFLSDVKKDGDRYLAILQLEVLPVINRTMVRATAAKDFFHTQYRLLQSQAAQKVFNSLAKENLTVEKSTGFVDSYGEDATTWLKEKGFTEFSGFGPKSTVAPAVDFYVAKKLDVSIKGYSTLPSLNELRKQIVKGKVNGPGALMKIHLDEYERFLTTDEYTKSKNQKETLRSYLEDRQKFYKNTTRDLLFSVSRTMFVLILGQVWFTDFPTLDDNSMDLEFDGNKLHFEARLQDIEVKI